MSESKSYTREEYIYLSRIYEKAEKYQDQFKFINKFIELDPKLSKEERNILGSGYKNIISDKRNSLRTINSLEKKKHISKYIYKRNQRKNRKRVIHNINRNPENIR